ncbi:uncharacterized protein B0H18DRAFT_491546 [Fomitopsis serialis]|uniref:uncharacterized protein n=1 Tax=Fomitopsis serialis TaxID=139415 RepID=UPI002007A083|nr:uncharacterized protein B0H18DRAFT_491546 [Neoantrodia serialis]KAH9934883.1 hypothetical protein B0H18DRAFT_491546 [Neoantrodia serialis]
MTSSEEGLVSHYVGVAFLGCTFVAFLYGITTAQIFTFWTSKIADNRALRWMVFSLWTIDGVHCALVAWPAYAWAVTNRSNILGILFGNVWTIRATVLLTGISNLGVRSIYIHRIWKLSSLRYLVALLTVFSLVNFALALTVAFSSLQESNLIKLFLAESHAIYASLACLAVSDMAVAIIVCVLLAQYPNTSIRTTNVIHTLMLHSVQSGLTTSIASMACLVTYATLMPNNACFFALFSILPKLALNSMLAMLNARTGLRMSHQNVIYSPASPGSFPLEDLSQNSSHGQKSNGQISINAIHYHRHIRRGVPIAQSTE